MNNKTEYERNGFGDNIHICMTGAFLTADHRNELEYGNAAYCRPVDREEVELSKEWLRKCAKKQDLINLEHSSYHLKHLAERYTPENKENKKISFRHYVSNGAFITAAIEEGYEYIIPHKEWNVHFFAPLQSCFCINHLSPFDLQSLQAKISLWPKR